MKNLFFSLILSLTLITPHAFAETIFKAEDFLKNMQNAEIQKVDQIPGGRDGGATTVTTYKDGTVMTIMPNTPNPPIVTWKLTDGSIYQTKAGSTDQYVQKQQPRQTTSSTTEGSGDKKTTRGDTAIPISGSNTTLADSDILNQIAGTDHGGGLSGVLNQLFFAGLVIAVILAIFMIIRGGLEYMTIDIASSKEAAKNRIKAALGGLVLCFSTILLLNTINPGLTRLQLNFPSLTSLEKVQVDGEELALVSAARAEFENSFVGPPDPNAVGVNTVGPIPTTYFGGPGDVRTKDGLALHYCDKPGVTAPGAKIGEYAGSTYIGGSEYKWCYALDQSGNKIPSSTGSVSAHGGYYEGTACGYSPLMSQLSGDYIAYPLPGSSAAQLTGLPSVSPCGKSVLLTLQNGTTISAAVRDTGPHGSIAKLDVSPSLSMKIQAGGGLVSVRLQ